MWGKNTPAVSHKISQLYSMPNQCSLAFSNWHKGESNLAKEANVYYERYILLAVKNVCYSSLIFNLYQVSNFLWIFVCKVICLQSMRICANYLNIKVFKATLFPTSFVHIWLQAYLICSHVDKSSTILFSCWVAKRLTVRFPVWENPKVD